MGWARGPQRTSSRTLKNARTFFCLPRPTSDGRPRFNGPTLTWLRPSADFYGPVRFLKRVG